LQEQADREDQAKERIQEDNTPVRKNDPRTSVQKNEEYRFAANIPREQTIPEKEYADYTLHYDQDDATSGKIPDVLLDVPVVKVDEINIEVNDLRAKVSLFAKVLDLVELSVGVDAYLGRLKIVIKGVEAQALLKVRLDNVTAIIDRVLTTIDRNPQIIEKLVESVGSAVEDVGEGAGSALEDVGEGAGSAVEDVGEGAGELVGGSTPRWKTSVKGLVQRWKTLVKAPALPSRMSGRALNQRWRMLVLARAQLWRMSERALEKPSRAPGKLLKT
jgi:hypothetical protein